MTTKRDKIRRARESTFTGRDEELALFRSLLPLERTRAIDILVIHGIGGMGKSRLLDQFQQLAADDGIPTARIDPQVQATVYSFLTTIHQQLKPGFAFPTFEKGVKRHQEIEMKLVGRGDVPRPVLRMFVKGTRAMIESLPGASALNELISAEEMEAHIGKIYAIVGRKEGDFWMKPEDDLTDFLVADLNAYCCDRRLVLMADTYEVMGAFDEWLRERVFANLGEHALLVVAGRNKLEGKGWQEFATLMRQHELQPFNARESDAYLQRKGITNESLMSEMSDYAGGHPLTLALLADLADQIEAGDLARAPERRDVIRALLERITQNIAANLRAALEVCAVLRVVNQDSLAWMLREQASPPPPPLTTTTERANAQEMFHELRRFDFVKVRNGGLALHDTVWAAMNEELRWSSPAHYREMNARAARYYEHLLEQLDTHERDALFHERLYHLIRSDETEGIRLLRERAEELVRLSLVDRLQELLNDMQAYALEREQSLLWRDYYQARVFDLQLQQEEAIAIYCQIEQHPNAEPELRAYALCDWGVIVASGEWIGKLEGGIRRAFEIVEESLRLAPAVGSKLAVNYRTLSNLHRLQNNWDEAEAYLFRLKELAEQMDNPYGVAQVGWMLRDFYLEQSRWLAALQSQQRASNLLPPQNILSGSREHLLGFWVTGFIWAGHYAESERSLREALHIIQEAGLVNVGPFLREMGLTLGLQGRFEEADTYLQQAYDTERAMGRAREIGVAITLTFWGTVRLRQGTLDQANTHLSEALRIKQSYNDTFGYTEILIWHGYLAEMRGDWAAAARFHRDSLDLQIGRHYFDAGALVGLVRIHHATANYEAIPALLTEAETLAQQYEYNDHLAALRLSQGHIAWDGHIPEWGSGFDAALGFYQQALIYALRYNRFLLDEVLWGGNITTPLRPIIPHCQQRGEEGQRMLAALRDWWQTGTNDTDTPRAETISLVPEGVPLHEAERIARENEPGDGSPQTGVVQQIERELAEL